MMTGSPQTQMNAICESVRGLFGFYIEDLTTGLTYERNVADLFPTASICKVPVLIELFRRVEEGTLSLDDRRRLPRDTSRQFATGNLSLLWDEPEISLRDHARLMIHVTDDMATDVLMEVVGLDKVNETMDRLGFANTCVTMNMSRWHYTMVDMGEEPINPENDKRAGALMRAGEENNAAVSYQGSLDNNVTAPREMASILRRLYEGQIISAQASTDMIELLKGGISRTRIPKFISPDIEIAHKTGGSGRIKGDVGILYLPTGPLIISGLALTDHRRDGNAGADAIAEGARLAVETLSPESVIR
jgi:beta-lactamase class A